MSYSDIPQINNLIAEKKELLTKNGISIKLKQKIPYGTQLFLYGKGEEGLINIYFSKKKGYSFVDCSSNGLSNSVISLIKGEIISLDNVVSSKDQEDSFKCWIGTDESGKGDFFGPLVVAGFIAFKEDEPDFKILGITDSKKLNKDDIHRIAEELYSKYANRISLQIFTNELYNSEYEKYKNLNHLLASGHISVINDLIDKESSIDGIIADKFADEALIRNGVKNSKIPLIQRTKGESNAAVAAASIIARYEFEKEMEKLSSIYETTLPFGAGANVKNTAKMIFEKWGVECLKSVVKKHFKTYNEIVS